ncbi:hypothetical protein CWI38_0030p0050 [Hamiltosporidium tvaerminnensis]|uniref:Uncharacterized protein n=1 Tax=Hamiltosporidium tvaerminnensis TaxID=1176355 RepID=A0A4Q9M564_9MICR|nr:hypothetical protein CWI38_0030p0050 [Hamiltosporidium tvaerminnensis]
MINLFLKSEKGKLASEHCKSKEIIIYFFKKEKKTVGLIHNFKNDNSINFSRQRHTFFDKISINFSYFSKNEYKINVAKQRNIVFEFGWNLNKFISLGIEKELGFLLRNILKMICKNHEIFKLLELYTNIKKFSEKINEDSICNLYIHYNSNELFIYEFIFDLNIYKLITASKFKVNLDKIKNTQFIDYLLFMIYGVTDDNNLSQNLISRANKRLEE